ncbi:DUF4158 domain-containing protein [Kitasatospora acidiphila]|uniref:DUF4158 domain-containing protein n=1 Tax=Kitasatospora acidiphila TaxID=2567942 RepID=UPI003C74A619
MLPLDGLRRFPEIGREELFRFFTPTAPDVALVDPGRGRGAADRLGTWASALVLKFSSRHRRFPHSRVYFPEEGVAFVARQMRVPAGDAQQPDGVSSTWPGHSG